MTLSFVNLHNFDASIQRLVEVGIPVCVAGGEVTVLSLMPGELNPLFLLLL